MDLTSRSLVVVGKRGSKGAMKTCRIHDLVRDLGLKKAEKKTFHDIHTSTISRFLFINFMMLLL